MPTTRYQHDEHGRLIASVTETEWDEEQQGLILALQAWRDDQCTGCGGALSETTLPEHEGRYHVLPPHRCHRCTALAAERDGDTRQYPQALHWPITLRT